MCLSFNISVIKHSVILLGNHLLLKKHTIPWQHSYEHTSALKFKNYFRDTYPSRSQGLKYSSQLCWACCKSPCVILLGFVTAFALLCNYCFLICFSGLFLSTKDCETRQSALLEKTSYLVFANFRWTKTAKGYGLLICHEKLYLLL